MKTNLNLKVRAWARGLKMLALTLVAIALWVGVILLMTGCNTVAGMMGGAKADAARVERFDEFDALRLRMIERIANRQGQGGGE